MNMVRRRSNHESGNSVEALKRRAVLVPRPEQTFGLFVVVQAAHSAEECWNKLWESFPPARLVAGLLSTDHARGFVIGNVVLVAFAAWCFFWPVRRQWSIAVPLLWVWVVIETINGLVHPLWSLREGGYTPGVATAPLLLCLAIYLAMQIRRRAPLGSKSK